MPIAKFLSLQSLVASLSKSEKRHFALFTNRLNSNDSAIYLKLFHLMNKYPEKDETYFSSQCYTASKSNFTNAKRHLFSQILRSLRIQYGESDNVFKARQRIDHAMILYKRGFYHESLSLLKSITLVDSPIDDIIALEGAELQKRIESRHITRSRGTRNRVEKLIAESKRYLATVHIESEMLNVCLEVQGLYIKWGFASESRDLLMYEIFFKNQLPELRQIESSDAAMVLWHQAHVWYYYMRLEFHLSYKHAVKWVEKCTNQRARLIWDAALYMRGMHYILTSCFYLRRRDKFEYWFKVYSDWRNQHCAQFDKASKLLDLSYFSNAELNYRIICNKFHKLDHYVHQWKAKIEDYGITLDKHRVRIFYYKYAMLYSYKGDHEKALDFINYVLDDTDQQIRPDIFCYARLLHLLCHYKLNNFHLILNLLPNVKLSFESARMVNPVVELMFSFLRRGSRAMNFGITPYIEDTLQKLKSNERGGLERIAFLYYDFTSWVESTLHGTTMEKIRVREE